MIKLNSDQEQYFLATTALEEFWDTTKPLLFLGDWCRRYGRKSFWEPLAGKVMSNPWEDRNRLYQSYYYCDDVFERFLPVLGDALNKIHGHNHGERYWRIVIGPWLHIYISSTYERHVTLQSALSQYPDLTTYVLAEDAHITPTDTHDFLSVITNDYYNLQIYSRILIYLHNKFPRKMIRNNAIPLQGAKSNLPTKTHIVWYFYRLLRGINRVFKEGHPVVLRSAYFSFRVIFKLLIKTTGRIWPMLPSWKTVSQLRINKSARQTLQHIFAHNDDFERLLSHLIPEDIPLCFIEGFPIINNAMTIDYPSHPKAIVSSDAWYFDETFKQWAAVSAEKGTLLIGLQHGGNYGSLKYHPNLKHEIGIMDRFLTWGWDLNDTPHKVYPTPAANLIGRRLSHANNRKQGILFVATIWPRYLIQYPYPPTYITNYLAWRSRFVNAIEPRLLPSIRVRFHRDELGWDLSQRWRDTNPGIAVDSYDIPFLQSLDNCRLYVCDHLSTTFLEALSAGKPTILFWDPAVIELRPEAQPYYDQLRAVDILYSTPEAAAIAANIVYHDIERWWNDPVRQSALHSFCDRFARKSHDAVNEWAAIFNQLAK